MRVKKGTNKSHPKGELEIKKNQTSPSTIDTYGGVVHVEWDPHAEVTSFGQLVYFVEFLKTAGLYKKWISDCPLKYKSNNGSGKEDIFGTLMLSILAGHKRYAHITSIRSDAVTPELLGLSKVVSEDSVRRGLKSLDPKLSEKWLMKHLKNCYLPILEESWILDIDTTVKPLYGSQEGAVVGYNPEKPGRPSHSYHTYFIANVRMILDVEVQAGNQSSSLATQPGLWKYVDSLPRKYLPEFIRGDCAFGNENMMKEAENRNIDYLFKLKQSINVKKLISASFRNKSWKSAGQGWEGLDEKIKLSGWTKERRVVVLRRFIKESVVVEKNASSSHQQKFAFIDKQSEVANYEYAVLITSMKHDLYSIAQSYRDRADIENVFDEMKNQWSWSGFTTCDLAPCQAVARIAALVFNWWSMFSSLVFPDKHAEAITTRPLLMHAVGRKTSHAGQKKITITSSHGKNDVVRKILVKVSSFLSLVRDAAEQLTDLQRWQIILSRIYIRFLNGKIIGTHPPEVLALIA